MGNFIFERWFKDIKTDKWVHIVINNTNFYIDGELKYNIPEEICLPN